MSSNLGQVAGLFIGSSAPVNVTLIWYDNTPSQKIHKVFNPDNGIWEALNKYSLNQITYSELETLATTSGLTIGSFYRITDKSNAFAIAITQTKLQYTDSNGNIVIDDLGANQEYIVSSSNLVIDDVVGVFDLVTKRVIFNFEELPFNESDFLIAKGVRNSVFKIFKFKISSIVSAVSNNSISWNNGLFFNFKTAISYILDKENGVVSFNAYVLEIQALNQSLNNLAQNYQNFSNQANQTIQNGLSDASVYGRQIPSTPSVTGQPSDIAQGDSLTVIFSKIQKYINKFKRADGITLTDSFVASDKVNLNNTDSVDSALRKTQSWINAFKKPDSTTLTSDFIAAEAVDLASSDTVDGALRKIQGWINKFKRATGILVSSNFLPETTSTPISINDSVDLALRKLSGIINNLVVIPIGGYFINAGVTAPSDNFKLANGAPLLISEYQLLYQAFGSENSPYGVNLTSNPQTFNLPNVPIYGSVVQAGNELKSLTLINGGGGYVAGALGSITLSNGAVCRITAVDANGTILTFIITGGGTSVTQGQVLTVVGTQSGSGFDAEFSASVVEIGGERTHLSTAEESGLPAHTHTVPIERNTAGTALSGVSGDIDTADTMYNLGTSSTGGSAAQLPHNNMPPYITGWYWIRVK